jgi:hypothetical protein
VKLEDFPPHVQERIRKQIALDSAKCSQRSLGGELPHPEQCQRPEKLEEDHAGEAPGAGCPRVRFTLRRCKLLDVDAKYASVKDLLDSLTYAGLIPGDKEGQIHLEVIQFKADTYSDEATEIEIKYPCTQPSTT